jgi:hypothetical protein
LTPRSLCTCNSGYSIVHFIAPSTLQGEGLSAGLRESNVIEGSIIAVGSYLCC